MYKGYKNILYYKNPGNNNLISNKLTKCSRCNKFNSVTYFSPCKNNIIYCIYCGNPI